MNVTRLLAAGVIVCVLGAAARADDKKEDKKETKSDAAKLIVGKWECSKADDGTVPPGTMIEFTKDGKLILSGKAGDQEFKMEGKYKVKGDKFDIIFKMGDQEHTEEITIKKIDDTTMSTTNKEGKMVELTRKK
jgi:uncharacterized protein (TIGR03066 family)